MRWNPGHFALFTEEVEDVIGFDKTRSSDYGVDLIMHAFYLFINPHDLSVFLQSRWFSLRTEGMWRLCTMGVHSKKKNRQKKRRTRQWIEETRLWEYSRHRRGVKYLCRCTAEKNNSRLANLADFKYRARAFCWNVNWLLCSCCIVHAEVVCCNPAEPPVLPSGNNGVSAGPN